MNKLKAIKAGEKILKKQKGGESDEAGEAVKAKAPKVVSLRERESWERERENE